MCGQLGIYSTTFSDIEYELFRNLLYLNVLRGEDSTGIIRIGRDNKLRTRKAVMSSPEFLKSEHSEICADQKGVQHPLLLMGHTRHATKGKVTLKNAHPFKFPKIVGMHNGTIHTHFKHRKEYETDSEALYRNINDYGIEKALNEVEAYDTAYALQYVDVKNGTINFVKNSKRPLYFTHIYAGTTLMWSSEKAALEFVVERKKMNPIGWDGDKDNPYFTLEDYDLLSLKLGERADSGKITSLKVEKKVYATTYTGSGGQTSQTTTYGARNQGQETLGDWIKTDRGYKFIPKKGNLSLVVDNGSKSMTSVPAVTSKKTKTDSDSASTSIDDLKYEDFKDRFGPEELSRLSWLQPIEQKKTKKETVTNDDNENVDEHIFEGYQGAPISEKEFRYRMGDGCFSCGEVFDVDDPHDFEKINKIHWGSRDFFACDECYKNSDDDWVKMTVDNTWPKAVSE